MKRYSCIKCGNNKFYRIIELFLLERLGLWKAKKIDLSKNVVYEAYNRIRQICLKDVPEIFSGTIEVDETYLGGQKKNN